MKIVALWFPESDTIENLQQVSYSNYLVDQFACLYFNHSQIMELIIFIGMQAVGKSAFYQQRFFNTHIRINLDMLKTRHREQILVNACLASKQPLVIDNTNVTRNEHARYITQAKAAHFQVVGYCFQSKIHTALKRNRRRSGRQIITVERYL